MLCLLIGAHRAFVSFEGNAGFGGFCGGGPRGRHPGRGQSTDTPQSGLPGRLREEAIVR